MPVVDLFWSASGVSGTCTACASPLSNPALSYLRLCLVI